MVTQTQIDELTRLLKRKADFEIAIKEADNISIGNSNKYVENVITLQYKNNPVNLTGILSLEDRALLAKQIGVFLQQRLDKIDSEINSYIISKEVK